MPDVVFYTLDFEDGQWVTSADIPYYVTSPFNFDIQHLAENVVVFIHHQAPRDVYEDFIAAVEADN